jgi:hypothetical protein
MNDIKVKVEGKLYVKMSSASKFALASTKGANGAKTTFFYLDKTEMLKALDACPELFTRNEDDVLCWKGLMFVTVLQTLNNAGIKYSKIPCNIARKDMKLDKHGTRATTQERFIAEFFDGKHIGGLKNSGGIAANESGKLADVRLQNGEQVEVKGWTGRLAGKLSWDKVEELYHAGIFTAEDVEELRKGLHSPSRFC